MISSSQLSAQRKAFSGFYISSVGDTIKGFFSDYKQWHKNPTRVAFIESATSKRVILTPKNCVKFIINDNDEYLAYSGPRLEDPLQDLQIVNNKELSTNDYQYGDIVAFLRLLSKSKEAELYIFSDKRRMNLFYKLPGQPITELKYKKIYKDNQIYDVEDYKQQLLNVFAMQITDKDLTRSLERLAYKEKDMMDFFDNLYQTGKPNIRHKDTASRWVLLGGVSINSGKVKYDYATDKNQEYHSSSISPLISIGYVVPLQRNFNKYFLFPEIKIFKYSSITGELNTAAFKNTITFKSDWVATLELNAGVNLINQEKLKMHISGGGGIKYLANNKKISESFALPETSPYSSSELGLPKIGVMCNLSAGGTFQERIVVIVSYIFRTPLEDNAGSTPRFGGIQLRAGYKF